MTKKLILVIVLILYNNLTGEAQWGNVKISLISPLLFEFQASGEYQVSENASLQINLGIAHKNVVLWDLIPAKYRGRSLEIQYKYYVTKVSPYSKRRQLRGFYLTAYSKYASRMAFLGANYSVNEGIKLFESRELSAGLGLGYQFYIGERIIIDTMLGIGYKKINASGRFNEVASLISLDVWGVTPKIGLKAGFAF